MQTQRLTPKVECSPHKNKLQHWLGVVVPHTPSHEKRLHTTKFNLQQNRRDRALRSLSVTGPWHGYYLVLPWVPSPSTILPSSIRETLLMRQLDDSCSLWKKKNLETFVVTNQGDGDTNTQ